MTDFYQLELYVHICKEYTNRFRGNSLNGAYADPLYGTQNMEGPKSFVRITEGLDIEIKGQSWNTVINIEIIL